MRRLHPALAAALLGACVPAAPAPEPAAPPPPVPAPRPAPIARPLPADWRDWPLTPGTWRYAREGAGRTTASFGSVLQLRCDVAQRRVTIATAGLPSAAPLTVRTTSTTRALPTAPATLTATDPLLDAMAFSRGHFTIEEAGRPPLVIPAHAEIGRVIEDCRG